MLSVALLSGAVLDATAQTAITSAFIDSMSTSNSTTYYGPKAHGAASAITTGSATIKFNYGAASGYTDNAKTLRSFVAGRAGFTYSTGVTTITKIRRVENGAFSSYWSGYASPESFPTPRDLAYYEGNLNFSTNTLNIKSKYIPKMEDLFQSNDISIGIDNLFANSTATNFNNIERIDVIIPGGMSVVSPGAQGFALFERGTYDAHDPATIALITSLDTGNNPKTYATTIVRIKTSDYYAAAGTSTTPNMVYQPSNASVGNFIVLRRDSTAAKMLPSDLISAGQGIGGVLIKFSDFGITAGTTVYGYSVLAGDFPASGTAADIPDYTNTTYYPTNTSSETTAGGNDMAVITGVVKILTISGNVYHDTDGLKNGLVDGTLINKASGVQLYVNLVDSATNNVVGSTAVAADGSFALNQLVFTKMFAQLSTTLGTVGAAAPAAGIPNSWGSVGENYGLNNDAGTGNEPGTPNSKIALLVNDENILGIKFGIEIRPTVGNTTLDTQSYNPMGTLVPAVNFVNADSDGRVTAIRVSAMPTGAASITVNGTTYTASGSGSTTAFPAAGISIPVTAGLPAQTVFVLPSAATSTVTIPYYAVDNAGIESFTNGTVKIPFVLSAVALRGTVWDDANGNGIMDSGEPTTNVAEAGEHLYALLVQTNNTMSGSPEVQAYTKVGSTGTYSFPNVPLKNNYTLRIVSLSLDPQLRTIDSMIAPKLASNWVAVSVNKGGDAPASGLTTTTQKLSISSLTGDLTNLNFGIEQLPSANPASYLISTPAAHSLHALSTTDHMGTLVGSDPEDMPLASHLNGKTVVINDTTGLNGNQLFYNNIRLINGSVIANYDSTKLQMRFEGRGSTSASFRFSYADAAGKTNVTPALYTVSFATPLPLTLLSFNGAKQGNTGILQWTTDNELNIHLFEILRSQDGTAWNQVGAVQTGGTGSGAYTFTDAAPENGSNYYRLRIRENDGTATYSPTVQLSFEGLNGGVHIYPNPATGQIHVEVSGDLSVAHLELSDLTGRNIRQYAADTRMIDLNDLQTGTYLIHVIANSGLTQTVKVSKQ